MAIENVIIRHILIVELNKILLYFNFNNNNIDIDICVCI